MHRQHRRHFLQQGVAAGVGFWAAGPSRRSWSSTRPHRTQQIQFACIGVDGKGKPVTPQMPACTARSSPSAMSMIVPLRRRWHAIPRQRSTMTFDSMLSEMGDQIDAVTVSTPDHTHAVAAVMAMRMGKHCFCQKPLTHSVHEARRHGRRRSGDEGQDANGKSGDGRFRLASGRRRACSPASLGRVQEVHVWTNRPVWPQGIERPTEYPGIPDYLHWYEWLGPAHERPYHPAYHPFKWRGFWDFGTGALGDMACHTFNMPYMGLNLRDPVRISAQSTGHNRETYPAKSVISFDFEELDGRAPCKFIWYDGGYRPGPELLKTEYIDWVREDNPDVTDHRSIVGVGNAGDWDRRSPLHARRLRGPGQTVRA